jgi:hypothetical protein
MSHRIGRIAALLATVTALGAVAVAAPPASAALIVTPRFTNWVVAGSLTAKKSQQTVTLPEGSTFNGSGELFLEQVGAVVLGHGTITGSVFVPPFNAVLTLPILGVPTPVTTGITFTQVGQTEGTITPARGCASEANACVTLTAPTKANVGFTVVGILGIQVPTHCETSEPIELHLSQTLNLLEIVRNGNHFTGTTTIPPIKCPGLLGLALGPVLTTALSGPENPYAISITPPPE